VAVFGNTIGIGGVRRGVGEIIVGGGKAKIGASEKELDTA
jgi:hypothetical protein